MCVSGFRESNAQTLGKVRVTTSHHPSGIEASTVISPTEEHLMTVN